LVKAVVTVDGSNVFQINHENEFGTLAATTSTLTGTCNGNGLLKVVLKGEYTGTATILIGSNDATLVDPRCKVSGPISLTDQVTVSTPDIENPCGRTPGSLPDALLQYKWEIYVTEEVNLAAGVMDAGVTAQPFSSKMTITCRADGGSGNQEVEFQEATASPVTATLVQVVSFSLTEQTSDQANVWQFSFAPGVLAELGGKKFSIRSCSAKPLGVDLVIKHLIVEKDDGSSCIQDPRTLVTGIPDVDYVIKVQAFRFRDHEDKKVVVTCNAKFCDECSEIESCTAKSLVQRNRRSVIRSVQNVNTFAASVVVN